MYLSITGRHAAVTVSDAEPLMNNTLPDHDNLSETTSRKAEWTAPVVQELEIISETHLADGPNFDGFSGES